MKDLELTCTLRNNRLKERRDILGLTRKALAEAAGIYGGTYGLLEGLKMDPQTKKGAWRKATTQLATFFQTTEEDLFPTAVRRVRTPQAVRKLDARDVESLLSDNQKRLLLPPDELATEREAQEAIKDQLRSLTVREETVLRARFGLDDGTDMSLAEVGERLGVQQERVRQIEAEALRKLRHPSRANRLDPEAATRMEQAQAKQKAEAEAEWERERAAYERSPEGQRELRRMEGGR